MGLDLPVAHLPNFVASKNSDLAGAEESIGDLPDGPYFLYVGRLEKLKGLHTLIPIFRRYPKAQLLIAGTGSCEAYLRKSTNGMDNIRFLGHLSEQQLRIHYRLAVALLVPSLCIEIFPLVILEAFREKTPAIVRNLGGMLEIIRESGGGFVYDTEDELIAALDRLIDDPTCRNELGRRGYETFKQKWTEEAHLTQYLKLINDLKMSRR